MFIAGRHGPPQRLSCGKLPHHSNVLIEGILFTENIVAHIAEKCDLICRFLNPQKVLFLCEPLI